MLYHMLASHGGAPARDVLRLARLTQARLGRRTACGSHASLRLASAVERPAARTPHSGSPRPSNGLRLARLTQARLGRRTACGSHASLRLASAVERPAARTTTP